MGLTLEQTTSFLETVLEFHKWKETLERDKLEFLRVLVSHYLHHTYFQNIVMIANPPEKRYVPDETTVVSIALEGVGGSCITQNGFLVFLLKALGFNSYAVSSEVFGAGLLPDNHVICIVEFEGEQRYLLDCGIGLPFHEQVPIHDLPYTKTAAGLRYRYTSPDKNGVYLRVQLDGGLYGGLYENKSHEHPRYDYTLIPRTMQYFQKPLADNFEFNFYIKRPTMFRYFEEDENGKMVDTVNIDGDKKWILIRGCSVLIGSDQTKSVTHYKSYDEVKAVVIKYFPKLKPEDVESAFGYFNATVAEHGYYRAKS